MWKNKLNVALAAALWFAGTAFAADEAQLIAVLKSHATRKEKAGQRGRSCSGMAWGLIYPSSNVAALPGFLQAVGNRPSRGLNRTWEKF